MAMSDEQTQIQDTQHAFLVAWGGFAEAIGLIQAMQSVHLHQKRYVHTPQAKVLELLAAILAGLEHLQDISLSAHPLDKDPAVAEAWGQPAWADYSGVSRTWSALTWEEVRTLSQVLDEVSGPLIQTELDLLRVRKQRLCYDGDLTGLPVSNSSCTYPNAAFGHMDDEIRLGYQAAVVSLESPTHRRLWLSIAHHPGDTVSCTQAEALVCAAEARTGLRPLRRAVLLRQRIATFTQQMEVVHQRLQRQQEMVCLAHDRLTEADEQARKRQSTLTDLEERYGVQQRPERPTSQLAMARKRLQVAQQRGQSRERALQYAQQRLVKTQAYWAQHQEMLARLQQRLERFERDNATNPTPVEAEFRLDAGFGTYENVALLIEMGYEVYTKAHNHRLVAFLQGKTDAQTSCWTRVGSNAEMIACANLSLQNCPYPLDVALERFYTGETRKHSVLLHFGTDPVTQDLPAWFQEYNGRQLIEAGIKEGKQVFYLHRIKVRSEPAIYLQECMVLFAANFIRWATRWLAQGTESGASNLEVNHMRIKRQVRVGAHASAQVIRDSRGKLLRFSEHSAFAGQVLRLPGGESTPPGRCKSYNPMALSNESHLIAQPLR
jgi:hypothetical protein